ncbi:P-loop containing nucleoside triphosphate hydrolase protein [Mycena leptocephala]|nr:P-loop containing nucleoside triphosphate hydrolase protein [Mycena leptocephala]
MPPNVTLNTRKIVILGSVDVGKSSLLKQFVEGNFPDGYYPTIESTATKTITYNGTEYPCEIIDTAGQDESSLLKSRHVIGIHGYVLVYSIASRASFNMIQVIYDKILNYSGLEEIAAIVVGSKADLNMRRQVDSRDGQELAQRNKTMWIEASALRNENVGECALRFCLR